MAVVVSSAVVAVVPAVVARVAVVPAVVSAAVAVVGRPTVCGVPGVVTAVVAVVAISPTIVTRGRGVPRIVPSATPAGFRRAFQTALSSLAERRGHYRCKPVNHPFSKCLHSWEKYTVSCIKANAVNRTLIPLTLPKFSF